MQTLLFIIALCVKMFDCKVAESRFDRAKAGAVLKEVKKKLGCNMFDWQLNLAATYLLSCQHACKCRGYSTA